MKAKLVLIALNCKLEIRNVYSDIAAVIPALPDDRRVGYTIEDIREVEETVFSLVIVSILVHTSFMFELESDYISY